MKTEDVIGTIESVLKQFNASEFMSEKIKIDALKPSATLPKGEIDQKKKDNVRDKLQNPLTERLKLAFKKYYKQLKWDTEQELKTGYEDRADILAIDPPNWEIIIEIDAARADQVAKKIVSRFTHISKSQTSNIVYMVLCYPGTKRMPLHDCKKYINYGEELLKKVHGNAFFISAFVKKDKDTDKYKIEIEKIPQFSATPSPRPRKKRRCIP